MAAAPAPALPFSDAVADELVLDRLMLLYPEERGADPSAHTSLHLEMAKRSCASAELMNSGGRYTLQKPEHMISIIYKIVERDLNVYEEVLPKFITRCVPYMDYILHKTRKHYTPESLSPAAKQSLILDFSSALCTEETDSVRSCLPRYKAQLRWLHDTTLTPETAGITDIKLFLKTRITSLLGSCLSESEASPNYLLSAFLTVMEKHAPLPKSSLTLKLIFLIVYGGWHP